MTRSPAVNRRQPGPSLDNLSARLVACDHALVPFRPFSQMLTIDGANVRSADGGGLHAQQHLAPAWLWHGVRCEFPQCCCREAPLLAFQSRFSRSIASSTFPPCAHHAGVMIPFSSQRSCHDWSGFHRKTWPLINRHLRSMSGNPLHFLASLADLPPLHADSPHSCAD